LPEPEKKQILYPRCSSYPDITVATGHAPPIGTMKLIPAKYLAAVALALPVLGLMACTSPQEQVNQLATQAGFKQQLILGKRFEHIVYEHRLDTYRIPEIHIYIDGDGTPWIAGRYPATNPTPSRPVALQLMAVDPTPAIYLGRPCYLGLEQSTNCSEQFWTSRRYSPEVIASMLSVINHYQQTHKIKKIVLIGYSGGGTLAALLARDLQQPIFFLTVGANLDTQLWTELRGFLPLQGSLNPIHYRADTAQTPQLHLAGLQDSVVPIAVTKSYTSGLNTKYSRYYPDFDHSCCWLEVWPEILAEKPWADTDKK
jgi:hypothetical protein